MLHPAYGVVLLPLCRCLPLWWPAGAREGGGCSCLPSGDVVFVEAAWDALLRSAVYVASASSACGFGRPGVLLSVSAVNNSQLAFRKFHLLTGLPAIG